MTVSLPSTSTTPNGERTCETTIVAAGRRERWRSSRSREVDAEQLVAVQREERARLLPLRRGETEPAAASERLAARRPRRSPGPSPPSSSSNCASQPARRRRSRARRPRRRGARPGTRRAAFPRRGRAASDDPAPRRRGARPCRPPGSALPLRRRFGLALGRLREHVQQARRRGRSPRTRSRRARTRAGSSRLRPSMISGWRIAARTSSRARSASSRPLGDDHGRVGAARPLRAASRTSFTPGMSGARSDPSRAPPRLPRAGATRARATAPRACRRCSA